MNLAALMYSTISRNFFTTISALTLLFALMALPLGSSRTHEILAEPHFLKLWLVRSIIEQHHSHVTFESDTFSVTVTLRIPLFHTHNEKPS
jgi:signal transduction histidine kinase